MRYIGLLYVVLYVVHPQSLMLNTYTCVHAHARAHTCTHTCMHIVAYLMYLSSVWWSEM